MAMVWDTKYVQEGRIQDNCSSRDQRGPKAEDHFSKLDLKPGLDSLGNEQRVVRKKRLFSNKVIQLVKIK